MTKIIILLINLLTKMFPIVQIIYDCIFRLTKLFYQITPDDIEGASSRNLCYFDF